MRLSVHITNGTGLDLRPQISEAVTRAGGVILEFAATGTSLDEVFARVTGEEGVS